MVIFHSHVDLPEGSWYNWMFIPKKYQDVIVDAIHSANLLHFAIEHIDNDKRISEFSHEKMGDVP